MLIFNAQLFACSMGLCLLFVLEEEEVFCKAARDVLNAELKDAAGGLVWMPHPCIQTTGGPLILKGKAVMKAEQHP